MKAAVFMGKGDVQVLNVPKPSIHADEVLIKVAYCGICGARLMKPVKDCKIVVKVGGG